MNDEPLTPAEQRLASLLALLRTDTVRTRPAFVETVMRRVQWQRLVREAFEAVAIFASTLVRGVGVLIGGPPGGGKP